MQNNPRRIIQLNRIKDVNFDVEYCNRIDVMCVIVCTVHVHVLCSLVCVCMHGVTEKPVVRSSYFEQMMHDVASTMHKSDVTRTQNTTGHDPQLTTDESCAVCEQHSSVSNDASATSSADHEPPVDSTKSSSADHQPPVDSTKSTQQLIGECARSLCCVAALSPLSPRVEQVLLSGKAKIVSIYVYSKQTVELLMRRITVNGSVDRGPHFLLVSCLSCFLTCQLSDRDNHAVT